jgi:hypothetical protein
MTTHAKAARAGRASATRHDGWTPDKQARFIDALSQSACVEEACRSVGMSRQSAYALRMRPDAQAFRVAWEAALDLGIRALTDAVISRALHGEVVPHFYQGQQVGEHRRYDNRLAMWLLRYRDPLRYAATLDQMVYKGHAENAAVAFLKAHNRMMDDAHDQLDLAPPIDASGPRPGDLPWQTTPIVEERHAAAEQALIESSAPIYGDVARRRRLQEARTDNWVRKRDAQRQADEAKAAAAGPSAEPPAEPLKSPATPANAMPARVPADLPAGAGMRPSAPAAESASGGDAVSTSSTWDPPPKPTWQKIKAPSQPSIRRLD